MDDTIDISGDVTTTVNNVESNIPYMRIVCSERGVLMVAQHDGCRKGHLQTHEGTQYECQDRCPQKQQVYSACRGPKSERQR